MNFTVLIVAPWYPAGPIKYIAEAFERIGCQIVRIGPTYNDHMGLDWDTDAVVPDQELPREAPCWNLNDLVDWTTRFYQAPDMLLVSEENYQTNIVPQSKIPGVLWSFDGWQRNYDRADLFQCTVNFANHPLGIDLYPRQEIDSRWQFLPAAAAPWVHKYLGLKPDIWDFCLLASDYGKRKAMCEKLVKDGFRVRYGQLATREYVAVYNRSLATFHNARPGEIKWRFFESAAMGCLNISGESKLFSWLGYKAWEEYIPIGTSVEKEWPEINDLSRLLHLLKNNPDHIRDIAAKARKRVLMQDTYLHRAKTVLSSLGFTDMVAEADKTIEVESAKEGA